MPRILLTVALNDLTPVQRQDPQGKNTKWTREEYIGIMEA